MPKQMRKITICAILIFLFVSVICSAHKGRTDTDGGHFDNNNVSGLGYYHYHCDGYGAHEHEDGVCSYNKAYTTESVPMASPFKDSIPYDEPEPMKSPFEDIESDNEFEATTSSFYEDYGEKTEEETKSEKPKSIPLYKLFFAIIALLLAASTPFALIWGICHINDAPKGERFKEFLIETGVGIYCGCMYMGILCGGVVVLATKQLFIAAVISLIATFIIHYVDMKCSGSLRDSYWTIEKNYKDFFEIESGYSNLIIQRNAKYDALSDAEKKIFNKNLDRYLKYKKLSSKRRMFFTDSFKGLATVLLIVFIVVIALQCQVDIDLNRFHE